MINRFTRIGIGAVLMAAAAMALLGAPARADIKTQALGNGNFNAELTWELPCGSENKGSSNYNQVPPGLPGISETHGVSPNPRVIISAIRVGGVIYSQAIALGGACAGENGLSALPPDTLSAGVGLYPPGFGADTTRMMRFAIIKTTGNIRLVCLGGGLQTGPVGGGQTAKSVLTVAVYPNETAANSDHSNGGAGANFFGRVTLNGGTGTLVNEGGFTSGDFTVTNDGSGRFSALPAAGLTKDVAVPDANAAVVTVIGDPRTTIPYPPGPLPGQSPIGLVVLTLSLMAVGFWVIRSRRSVTVA